MLLQELKVIFRKLQQEINYTLINLTGLTLGISFSFLICVYVSDQLAFDEHIPHAVDIYRIAADFKINNNRDIYANTPRPVGPALVREYPGIVAATKIIGYDGLQNHHGYLKAGEDLVYSTDLFLADSNFFKVFEVPLLAGTYQALHEPNTAVISSSMAKNLFGTQDAMGKSFVLDNQKELVVRGIFPNHEKPTYLRYEVLVSYTTYYDTERSERWWFGGHCFTYIRTRPGFDPNTIYANWQPFYDQHMKATMDQMNGIADLMLQPLTELYLAPEYIWEPYAHGSWQSIFIFSAIGIFLLLVACFNFTNLSLSQSLYRQKEVSVRKVLGAGNWSLIRSRVLQSVILSVFAGLLAISLLSTLVPIFNKLTITPLSVDFMQHPERLLWILLLSGACGVVSSIYPAIYEASFRFFLGAAAFSAKSEKGLLLRKVFVTGQLVISMMLIISTMVVIDQINYVKDRDLGFEADHLVILHIVDRQVKRNMGAFVEDIRNLAGVESVARLGESPKTGFNEFSYMMQNKSGEYVACPSQTIAAGLGFVNTMGLELMAGRMFETEDVQYQGLLINEFLAARMGYTPEEAVGARVIFGQEGLQNRKVIGVINNFSMGSAQEPLQAITIGHRNSRSFLLVRLGTGDSQQTLDQMGQVWARHGSGIPFSWSFFQTEMDGLLGKENRLYRLLILGSLLIIFISSLGLLGLISHVATHKVKEIGIRKVMGAAHRHLAWVMIRDFVKTYSWALVIGSGLAWYLASSWLSAYAYRVDFNWGNILVAGMISLAIVLFTLSIHTIRVIQSDPVDSLKYE